MQFVLVNERSPRPESSCALCCETIGESYLPLLQLRVLPRLLQALLLRTQETCEGIMTIQGWEQSCRGL